MKVKPSNGLNLILPADVTLYPNSNHTFIGCQQPAQSCVVCREPNGIFISIKIDKTLRKCECQPVIHLECFRKYADPHWFSEEIAIPCLSCNGPTLIRSTRDVILTAVYNLTGWNDEDMDRAFEKFRELYVNFGNPAAADLHILELASRLRSDEARLKRALLEIKDTRRTLHLRSGQTRASIRKAAKCYDRLPLEERDNIVTQKLVAQLTTN
jgi:hypothetical protein